MAKVHFGSNPVSHELFEFFDVGEPALVGSRPDDFVIDTYLEQPARAGYEGDLTDHALERFSSSCAIQAARSSQRH